MGTAAIQVEFIMNGVHDRSGGVLAGGSVYTYAAGTNVFKALYLDRDKTAPTTGPVTLDSEGKATVYADGLYKFVIKDSSGVTIKTLDDLSFADLVGETSFAAPVTITSTTAPQLTIARGSHTVEVSLDASGVATIDTDNGLVVSSTSGAQVTLDNGAQQATFEVDASGNVEVDAPKLELTNGAGLVSIAVDASSNAEIACSGTLGVESTGAMTLTSAGGLTVDANTVLGVGKTFTVSGAVTINSTLTVADVADLSTAGVSLPVMDYVAGGFTLGANWTHPATPNMWVRVGNKTSGGFVMMAGSVTAQAGATATIGTITNTDFIPANTVAIPVQGVGGTGGTTVNTGSVNINASTGVMLLTWDQSTALATGDYVLLSGVSYPLK